MHALCRSVWTNSQSSSQGNLSDCLLLQRQFFIVHGPCTPFWRWRLAVVQGINAIQSERLWQQVAWFPVPLWALLCHPPARWALGLPVLAPVLRTVWIHAVMYILGASDVSVLTCGKLFEWSLVFLPRIIFQNFCIMFLKTTYIHVHISF